MSSFLFFDKCWEIIQEYLVQAINHAYNTSFHRLWLMTLAYIALFPEKDNACRVGDFRPISFIHALGKMFSKLLAYRLTPKLQQLVSKNQSAFIKWINIKDNFLFVNNMVKELH